MQEIYLKKLDFSCSVRPSILLKTQDCFYTLNICVNQPFCKMSEKFYFLPFSVPRSNIIR